MEGNDLLQSNLIVSLSSLFVFSFLSFFLSNFDIIQIPDFRTPETHLSVIIVTDNFLLELLFKIVIYSILPSLLVGALQTAGLTELMNQPASHTVFAPTNDAFSALPPADLNKLMGNVATVHTNTPKHRHHRCSLEQLSCLALESQSSTLQ